MFIRPTRCQPDLWSAAVRTATCLLAAVSSGAFACGQNPYNEFPLGFEFVDSFEAARQKAVDETRIIMLVPTAPRSRSTSSGLDPAIEAFRAGPLVDDRISRLMQRRFVAYGFEMNSEGARYDAEATEIAARLCPDLQYSSITPTAPVMFITPEGKELGRADLLCSTETLLKTMSEAVAENEHYRELTDRELILGDTEKATLWYDLRQFDRCLEMLRNNQASEAHYLKGAIARERGEWAEMKAAFKMVYDERRLQDVQLQELLRFLEIGNFEGIKAAVPALDQDFPHWQQAQYLLGLAFHHSGESDQALDTWEAGVNANPGSAWALRLDWTRAMAKSGPDSQLLLRSNPESLLGRNYLSPQSNPDLIRD